MTQPNGVFEPRRPAWVATAVYFVTTVTLMWPMALGQFLVNPMRKGS